MEQLYLLDHQQGAEFRGKSFDEILIREDSGPMRSTVSIIIVPGAGSPDRYRGATCSIPGAFVSSAWGRIRKVGSHERSGLELFDDLVTGSGVSSRGSLICRKIRRDIQRRRRQPSGSFSTSPGW